MDSRPSPSLSFDCGWLASYVLGLAWEERESSTTSLPPGPKRTVPNISSLSPPPWDFEKDAPPPPPPPLPTSKMLSSHSLQPEILNNSRGGGRRRGGGEGREKRWQYPLKMVFFSSLPASLLFLLPSRHDQKAIILKLRRFLSDFCL